MIIEAYLPLDYYAMMLGVLVDQKVFMHIVEESLPGLFKKFKSIGLDASILAF